MVTMIDDRTAIDGLHMMINTDDLESDAPLEDIEKKIVEGELFVTNDKPSNVQNFDDLLNELNDGTLDRGALSPTKSLKSIRSVHDMRNIEDTKLQGFDGIRSLEDDVRSMKSMKSMKSMRSTRDDVVHKNRGLHQHTTEEEESSRALREFFKSNNEEDDDLDKYDITQEKINDDKLLMIEQIENLKANLELEGEDMSRFNVSEDDSYDKVKKLWEKLKLKSQYKTYSSMFESGVILGAECVEWAFNGKRDYFGYKPDMTGWSDTVHVRLQRMRLETASFVSNVMQEYKISAGLNIFTQLILSGIMYSVNKNKENQDAMTTNGDTEGMPSATLNRNFKNAIRDMDD